MRSTVWWFLGAWVVGSAAGLPAQGPAEARLSSVDSLVAAGRLQEAAWVARERGDTATGEAILRRLRSILESTPATAEPLSMDSQGVSYSFRVAWAGGVGAIFKLDGSDIFCPACGADREVAAYEVDRLLGLDLTPMTIRTTVVDPNGDTLSGSAMYFVHGATSPRDAQAEKPDRLRFFDAVIGNSDRHKSNWLVLAGDRAVAIDHNRAFQYRPAMRPKTCWETEVDSIARPAALGHPYARYRTLPAESLRAAVAGLDPELVREFLAMRERVVGRIEARAGDPDGLIGYRDCRFPR